MPEKDAQGLSCQSLATTSRNMAVARTCELRTPLAIKAKVKVKVKFAIE